MPIFILVFSGTSERMPCERTEENGSESALFFFLSFFEFINGCEKIGWFVFNWSYGLPFFFLSYCYGVAIYYNIWKQ